MRYASIKSAAFTLIEMLVAVAILAMIVVMMAGLFAGAGSATGTTTKRLDSDAQARGLLDRMTIDLSKMLRRNDVDYFFKTSATAQTGDDQMAFFSQVDGYFSGTSKLSPFSLVGYRINQSSPRAERMGKGLVWNGDSAGQSLPYLPLTIVTSWPTAASQAADSDYEVLGRNIFRFEYYYILRGAVLPSSGAALPSMASADPWDVRIPGHTSISGLRDVSAIVVVIAAIDPQSRAILGESNLKSLAASLLDFAVGSDGQGNDPAQLWETAVANANLPKKALAGIRVYQRYIFLEPEYQ